MTRVGLSRAVNGGHLGRAQLGETLLEHETLAASVGSDQQERLFVRSLKPWQDAVHASLDLNCFYNRQLERICQLLVVV